ncbi:MAG: hypothetical protein HKP27_06510 [Myxococcales bacterium]|nr:hypothetical protein [Myxococcales bacterium]
MGTARDIYGVVVDPQSFAVDEEATRTLRSQIAKARGELPALQPTGPDAATWLAKHMREGDEYLLDPQ